MEKKCVYCGKNIYDHDPVVVYEYEEREGEEVEAGGFCNYACLSAYIEEEGLEEGACCQIDYD